MPEKAKIVNKTQLGLIKLRKRSGRTPTYHCENCGCKRYSPCGCEVSEKKKKKNA